MKSKIRLIKNLLAVALLFFLGYLIFNYFTGEKEKDEWEIENSPLQIEAIKTIAEISTISYRDEVVIDSVEFYQTLNEKIAVNAIKLVDLDQWKYGIKSSNIKRRLTLIVRGEVRYGMNLTRNNYNLKQNNDSIWLTLPKPQILDVLVTPSTTEIFIENGEWNDYERKALENKAKNQLRLNSSQLNLEKKTTENISRLFENLIPGNKAIIFKFN